MPNRLPDTEVKRSLKKLLAETKALTQAVASELTGHVLKAAGLDLDAAYQAESEPAMISSGELEFTSFKCATKMKPICLVLTRAGAADALASEYVEGLERVLIVCFKP